MAPTRPSDLRCIPEDFDRTKLGEIDQRLTEITRDDQVAIGLAIESGSRAWGFPSPDSDYDCRFIFVRPAKDYLSPWQERDVIETPLIDDLDINGWELSKALKLLLKGNAIVVEWLMSPIIYTGDAVFRDKLAALAQSHANRAAIARHYLHLGRRQRQTYFADEKQVALKKIFYALRPAMALRWLNRHPEAVVPPMHFQTLLHDCDIPADVLSISEELIARKALTREVGSGALPPVIRDFIDREYALAEQQDRTPVKLDPQAKADASAFFRAMVERFDSAASSRQPEHTEA